MRYSIEGGFSQPFLQDRQHQKSSETAKLEQINTESKKSQKYDEKRKQFHKKLKKDGNIMSDMKKKMSYVSAVIAKSKLIAQTELCQSAVKKTML